jgi:membrane dipeptidase
MHMKTLDRRDFVRLSAAAALSPWLAGVGCAGEGASSSGAAAGRGGTGVGAGGASTADAWAGYDDAVVIDALAGPIQFNIPQQSLPLDDSVLDAVRRSGITAVNLTVNGRASEGESAHDATWGRIREWERELEAHPDVFALVRGVDDIRGAKETGRLGLILGFQDTVPVQDDPARLDAFHGAGLLVVQLTYNVENRVGSGSLVPSDRGLTDLGRDVVARLDELGIVVDLSHCGPRTTLDGIEASTNPVAITHSGCNAVYRHPRSKDDEALRAMAERGGVVGIYLMPFLNPSGPPSAEDVLAHVEHALDVCGEDHVGIGSDQGIVPLDVSGDFAERFEQVSAQRSALGIAAPREDTIPYVPDLNHPRRLETIASMMEARGHSAAVIEKVIGGNFLRLFEEVWA